MKELKFDAVIAELNDGKTEDLGGNVHKSPYVLGIWLQVEKPIFGNTGLKDGDVIEVIIRKPGDPEPDALKAEPGYEIVTDPGAIPGKDWRFGSPVYRDWVDTAQDEPLGSENFAKGYRFARPIATAEPVTAEPQPEPGYEIVTDPEVVSGVGWRYWSPYDHSWSDIEEGVLLRCIYPLGARLARPIVEAKPTKKPPFALPAVAWVSENGARRVVVCRASKDDAFAEPYDLRAESKGATIDAMGQSVEMWQPLSGAVKQDCLSLALHDMARSRYERGED
jgi:hypothetical protein